MRLVRGPNVTPRAAELFPFWLALVVATVALGLGAVGARQWILSGFFVMQHEVPSVLGISIVELREEEKPREAHLPRVAPARPFAPSTVRPVPIPSLRPELVQAPPLPAKVEPYDPSEDLEAAADPFPTRPEAKPEPVVAERRPKEISKPERRRPTTRQNVTPKLVAKGPSYPAKVLRRYQPAYPRSARRAGVEGRVRLAEGIAGDVVTRLVVDDMRRADHLVLPDHRLLLPPAWRPVHRVGDKAGQAVGGLGRLRAAAAHMTLRSRRKSSNRSSGLNHGTR